MFCDFLANYFEVTRKFKGSLQLIPIELKRKECSKNENSVALYNISQIFLFLLKLQVDNPNLCDIINLDMDPNVYLLPVFTKWK